MSNNPFTRNTRKSRYHEILKAPKSRLARLALVPGWNDAKEEYYLKLHPEEQAAPPEPAAPRVGRPPGSSIIGSPERLLTVYRQLAEGGQRVTQADLARALDVQPRTLWDYRRKHGIPWPPE